MTTTHHLGLEIAPHAFRMVEVRFIDKQPTVLHVDEFETEHNFGSHLLHDAPFHESLTKSFLRDLTLFFKRQNFFSSTIAVALPSHLPFISIIPIDVRLSKEEQLEHIRWECSLHSMNKYSSDWKIATHVLRENCDANTILAVALPQSTIRFLESALSLLTFKLAVLDVNHFTVEHAVRSLDHQKTFALIGFHQDYFTLSFYDNERYIGFSTGKNVMKEQCLSPVLRSLHDMMQSNDLHKLERVYVYGPCCDDALIYSLQGLLQITITLFNPISSINFINADAASKAFNYPPNTYCAALGAALRCEV